VKRFVSAASSPPRENLLGVCRRRQEVENETHEDFIDDTCVRVTVEVSLHFSHELQDQLRQGFSVRCSLQGSEM